MQTQAFVPCPTPRTHAMPRSRNAASPRRCTNAAPTVSKS